MLLSDFFPPQVLSFGSLCLLVCSSFLLESVHLTEMAAGVEFKKSSDRELTPVQKMNLQLLCEQVPKRTDHGPEGRELQSLQRL